MIHINRFVDYGKPDEGTFGTLTFNNFFCYTVEKPWVNNVRYMSCIPPGDYFLEYYDSPKFGPSCIIHGGTVSKFPDGNFERYGILIHPANWSSDVTGCIGLGETMTVLNNRAAVTNSRKTVAEFLKLINIDEVYDLRITYSENF
jgi:hypothetical protein